MTKSYARWRSNRLGQITDALEQRLLFELLGSVAGKTLLDVGCGDGALAAELVRRRAFVTGLDTDPMMIAAARQRSESEATPLRLVEGRAEALPFGDNSFDYTLSVTTLCFVQEARRAVAEMARVLKPGGRLVIGELGRWSLWSAHRRIRGWFGDPTWRTAKFRTAAGLSKLVRARCARNTGGNPLSAMCYRSAAAGACRPLDRPEYDFRLSVLGAGGSQANQTTTFVKRIPAWRLTPVRVKCS